MSIAKRITELRKQQGWTQSDLARKTGITSAGISQMEKHDRIPCMSSILKICSVFNIQIQDLMNHADFQDRFTRDEASIFFVYWVDLTRLNSDDQYLVRQLINRLLYKPV